MPGCCRTGRAGAGRSSGCRPMPADGPRVLGPVGERVSEEKEDPNDDECGVCGKPGDLACCDGCPGAFHPKCIHMTAAELQADSWLCPKCRPREALNAWEIANVQDLDKWTEGVPPPGPRYHWGDCEVDDWEVWAHYNQHLLYRTRFCDSAGDLVEMPTGEQALELDPDAEVSWSCCGQKGLDAPGCTTGLTAAEKRKERRKAAAVEKIFASATALIETECRACHRWTALSKLVAATQANVVAVREAALRWNLVGKRREQGDIRKFLSEVLPQGEAAALFKKRKGRQ